VVLNIPTVAQVQALNKEQAQQQFDRQLQQWEESRLTGKPLVCPPETTTQSAAVTPMAAPAGQEAPVTQEAAPAGQEAPVAREAPAAKAAPAGAKESTAAVVRPVEKPRYEDWLFERKHPVALEWAAVALFGLLLLGILFWRFRRKPTVAAAAAVVPPGEDFAKLSVADTLGKLQTDGAQGLTAAEAAKRLKDYGPNALEEKKVTLLQQLLPFFWGPIPWMIEVAAVLSLLTQDWQDFTIIMVLLLFNAALGFHESRSAANALAALKGQLALKARARRDGQWQEVEAGTLVPGDIIRIRLGDIIPADAKLIEGEYLTIDQAALTGESLPVNKQSGELAFSGSVAKQGEMVAVVTGTGANTFFGRTAQLVESAGAQSHLQEAVLQVGNFLILTAILLCVLLTAVELYWGASFLKMLKIVLILVVASIPVAMPAVLSVTLALGALALSKLKAIVSRLEAIEEMAGVDILCSDKTGTLTKNQLTLGEVKPFGSVSDQELILAGALASKAENNDAIDLAVSGGLQDANALKAYTQT
jgi:magnesium-transporting ATPase (P-type)